MIDFHKIYIDKANNQIVNSSDRDLFSDNFETEVFEKSKIEIPTLDISKTNVLIEFESVRKKNSPLNFNFKSGQKINYALYKVPIVGDISLFSILIHGLLSANSKYIDGNNLIYKEYSLEQIEGNDVAIDEIKNMFIVEINFFIKILDKYRKEALRFNKKELKEIISNSIIKERENRNSKIISEKKLNPFI